MGITIYNPQKGRLETIAAEFSKENTTWFENCGDINDIALITDIDDGILICENGYSYPVMIYGVSRTDITFNPQKAKKLKIDTNERGGPVNESGGMRNSGRPTGSLRFSCRTQQ